MNVNSTMNELPMNSCSYIHFGNFAGCTNPLGVNLALGSLSNSHLKKKGFTFQFILEKQKAGKGYFLLYR